VGCVGRELGQVRARRSAYHCISARGWSRGIYSGLVLELNSLDLEEIALALADQADYEHRRLINPQTGEIVFWTAGTTFRPTR
jgi:hypothetical protein